MKAVCLISGGMDSSTLAYIAREQGYDVYALHLNYGQRTQVKELACARAIAESLPAREFLPLDLTYFALLGGSSLTDPGQPVRDYDPRSDRIPDTYVPFRNANLLAIATSYAEARDADAIFIGVQAQDYSGYPDCRPSFIEAFQALIDQGTREPGKIRLKTPFVTLTKREILGIGLPLGVPYHLTWSCYRNNDRACGTCGACHFRLAAFAAAGVRDPIPYVEE